MKNGVRAETFAVTLCYNLKEHGGIPMSISNVYAGPSCQSDAGAQDKLSDAADTMTPTKEACHQVLMGLG